MEQKEPKKPIKTKIQCKSCGAVYYYSPLKEEIKRRIFEKFDAELDWILEEI